MAGQADKKRAKNAAETIVYYQGAVAIATLLYLLALACLDPGVTQVGFWTLVEAAFFVGVTYLTYSGIEIGLNMGTDYSTYQDIFIINTFVQLTVSYVSRWFWWLYLVVPGYALWKLWDFVKAWCSTSRQHAADADAGKSKTQLKKEARASKPAYKVMRG
eukprot:g10671.t1